MSQALTNGRWAEVMGTSSKPRWVRNRCIFSIFFHRLEAGHGRNGALTEQMMTSLYKAEEPRDGRVSGPFWPMCFGYQSCPTNHPKLAQCCFRNILLVTEQWQSLLRFKRRAHQPHFSMRTVSNNMWPSLICHISWRYPPISNTHLGWQCVWEKYVL